MPDALPELRNEDDDRAQVLPQLRDEPGARHARAGRASLGRWRGGGAPPTERCADQSLARRRTSGLLAGVFVVLFGLLLIAFLPGKGFKFLGVASALIGIVAALVSFLSPLRSMGTADAEAPSHALDGTAPNTGRLLHEQTFEHVPASVTDHTTELLNVELKGEQSRRDD
jgi:hypothetical protein